MKAKNLTGNDFWCHKRPMHMGGLATSFHPEPSHEIKKFVEEETGLFN